MDTPIESISFTEREKKYYSIEFDNLTIGQSLPIPERQASSVQLSQFLKQLKISEENSKKIWDLVSEGRTYLKLSNFMAAMRLCSAFKQGKPIIPLNFRSEQQVLARKSRNAAGRGNKTEEDKKVELDKPNVIEKAEPKFTVPETFQEKKEIPSISLQVSQEMNISRVKGFEDVKIDSDDEEPLKTIPENLFIIPPATTKLERDDTKIEEKLSFTPNLEVTQKFDEDDKAGDDYNIDQIEKPEVNVYQENFIMDYQNFKEPVPVEAPKKIDKLRPQEKVVNAKNEGKSFSPTRLDQKPEESKHSLKLYPRVPSLPKIYKGPLTQIPEEVTPPRSSSSRDTCISVDNPVLITSGWLGSTSYYIYSITTRISGKVFNVKRRFSDLDWMHNQLLSKYKGFIVPSRPEKKMLGKNEEKFVEERRLQMEKYLSIIAKHPILGSSFAFKTFTQTPNEKFEREKLNAEGVEEYSEYRSIEDAMDKVYALVQNKIQLIFSQKVIPFSDEVSSIEENIVKLEAPIQTFSGSFAHWVQVLTESNKNFTGMSISKDFIEKMQNLRSLSRENSEQLKHFSLEVKEEQLRLEGLKEALNTYKTTVEECSKLQNLISRKLGKLKSSSNEDTKARYLSEIQSTQDTIDKYTKDFSEIEKNLIKENSTFESSKSEHLEQTLSDLVFSQNSHWAKEKKFWASCLSSID